MVLTNTTLLISKLATMSLIDQKSFMEKLERVLTVQNKMGIHARPAAMIVRLANKYEGEVWVEKDDEQVNGKSIMGLMMLAAGRGSKLRFTCEGDAAAQLLDEMEALFERRFEEA
jgi:phosphocarrier protein HPr